jgi:MFS transporter, putative metabolite:H+ symporter
MRMGRFEEARRSLAWALQMDPKAIELPAAAPAVEHTRWTELFKYPRSIFAGALTGLSQTGGVGLALWQVSLLVMVLQINPAEASKLGIWIAVAAIAGRFLCSWISDAWGRRPAGVFSCLTAAVCMSLAGYMHSVFALGVSMFYVMLLLQSFFGSGNYSIVGPYMGELWPGRLRGSGMGFVYGIGNLGKFIGPAGLALIAGSSNYVKPEATLDALIPGFNYFAFWYVLGAFAFWFIGFETSRRSIGEIDSGLGRSANVTTASAAVRSAGN